MLPSWRASAVYCGFVSDDVALGQCNDRGPVGKVVRLEQLRRAREDGDAERGECGEGDADLEGWEVAPGSEREGVRGGGHTGNLEPRSVKLL